MSAPVSRFHAGERAIQQRAGFGNAVDVLGSRFICDALPVPHQTFFAQLPWVLVGVLDAQGRPRAGALAGPPGFVSAVDDTHLDIRIGAVLGAGVADGLAAGAPLGVLGLEAHTRRRNRVNGEIVEAAGDGLRVRVSQSFGNCPKYIHPRRAEWAPGADQPCRHTGWDDAARRIVAAADTFFIASAHPAAGDSRDATHGVDISHRGGEAGFVTVAGETLSVPDYPGNRFFNTLGNLELNPWASLLFIDFTTRETLQLAVRARIEWHPVAAGCRLDFEVLGAERSVGGLPLIWSG